MPFEDFNFNINDLEKFKFRRINDKTFVAITDDGEGIGVFAGPVSPTITNLVVTNANTEETHVLQNNVKRLVVKARKLSKIKLSYTSGQSGTNYITIPSGGVYEEDNINMVSGSLYLQTDKDNTTIEILEWS